MDFYIEKVHFDFHFKGVYEESLLRALFFNQQRPRNFQYHICNDVFMTIPVVIYARKNFYLIEELNEKIGILKSAGLINFWHFQPINKRISLKSSERDKTAAPKVLRLHQLIGTFETLGIGILISSVTFILELLILK